MLIKDFIEIYKESPETALSQISIKTHISFRSKYNLIEQVKDSNIEFDGGIYYYNSLNGDFVFNVTVIKNYTNLEFSEESMDELDELQRIGAFDKILDAFSYDYSVLQRYYKEKVDIIINMESSTQTLLNREILKVSNKAVETLNKISSNLDKKTLDNIINMISKGIKDFDISKIAPMKK